MPVPRFEALCLKSKALVGLDLWSADAKAGISSDVRSCWNKRHDHLLVLVVLASRLGKPSNSPRRCCIHPFVRGPRPDLGATNFTPGHMFENHVYPRRSILPIMIIGQS